MSQRRMGSDCKERRQILSRGFDGTLLETNAGSRKDSTVSYDLATEPQEDRGLDVGDQGNKLNDVPQVFQARPQEARRLVSRRGFEVFGAQLAQRGGYSSRIGSTAYSPKDESRQVGGSKGSRRLHRSSVPNGIAGYTKDGAVTDLGGGWGMAKPST